MKNSFAGGHPLMPTGGGGAVPPPLMLVLDDGSEDRRDTVDLPRVHFCESADCDAALLRELAPDVVVSSLVMRSRDAVEVATILSEASFRGSYMVLTGDIPHTDMIGREIARAAPRADVRLIRSEG